MFTVEQLKTKDCPYQTQIEGSTIVKVKCDPDNCAMWRWTANAERRKDDPNATGFCGCAGQPHEFIP